MDYQKLFDLMSEHGLALLEGEMDEIIETVNEIQQPLKEQGERSGAKTAEDYLKEYSNGWDKIYIATAEIMMKQYATHAVEAVLNEVVNRGSANINISDFIK